MKPVVSIAVLALAASQSLLGQSAQALSAQASVLYSGLSGHAYQGFNSGPGLEAQARYTATNGFSLGVGYQRTVHSVAGASGNATLSGPFVEPRYTFEIKGHDDIYPYASLRAAALKQRFSGNGVTSSASGFSANAGGGILFRLTSRVNLDIGATVGITKFSNFITIEPATGQRIAGETGSGSNFVLRSGLAVGVF